MEQLALWRSLTQERKLSTAQAELQQAFVSRYQELADGWDWQASVEEFSPREIAEIVIQSVEQLLGLQFQLEWDYDADAEDLEMVGCGATAYWFKVSDPESGIVLTHNPANLTGAKLRCYKLIETYEDAVKAIVELADIISEKLPVARGNRSISRR